MKTIALSCTGEGFGHAARTAALADDLRKKYRVVVFCPRHVFPFMRDNLGEIDLEEIPYFSFVKHRERIDYARTVWANLPKTVHFPLAVRKIAKRLRAYNADALISDYDPFGAFAADSIGMPILQINHPSVVLRQRDFSLEAILAKIISLVLMGKYHRKLIVSFYNGDVGPLVRRGIQASGGGDEDFFVAYLKPSYRKVMLQTLRRLSIRNVHVFPDPNKNIIEYLSRCRGVISSAGHQFMSEALVLGKPVFVVPQMGQYEQRLNAEMLEKSGRGTWSTIDDLDTRLPEFVHNIAAYPRPSMAPEIQYRFDNDIDRVVRKIEDFVENPPSRQEPMGVILRDYLRAKSSGQTTHRHPILPVGM